MKRPTSLMPMQRPVADADRGDLFVEVVALAAAEESVGEDPVPGLAVALADDHRVVADVWPAATFVEKKHLPREKTTVFSSPSAAGIALLDFGIGLPEPLAWMLATT